MKSNEIKGTLQPKKGSPYWYMVFSYYDSEGNRKKKWESTGIKQPGNKREAQARLKARLEELNHRIGPKVDLNMTISELTVAWLEEIKQHVRQNTYERYALNAKKIITYFDLKNIKVVDCSRKDIKFFINYLLKKGKKNQKTGSLEPLSPTSVRDIAQILGLVFNYAVDMEIIQLNPARGVKIPNRDKNRTKNQKEQYLTLGEAKAFLKFLEDRNDPLKDVVATALSFGLRRSEILGLTWDKINLPQRYISVESTITATTTLHYENNTKNIHSARIIPITDEECEFFKRIQAQERAFKKEYNELYTNNSFVFKWPDGRPFRPDFVTKHLKLLFGAFGHPDLHFHSLRHSWMSAMAEAGIDELEVQRLAGHAPGSTVTRSIYTHIDKRERKPHSLEIIGVEGEQNDGTE